MNTMLGMKVTVTPDIPKMQMAPGDYITPEFRLDMDAWLIRFFGVTNLVPDGEVMTSQVLSTVFMNQRTYAKLRHMVKEAGS